MKRKNYRIEINASAAHVFETMLGKTTYKQWTAEFNPTSDFEGHWELGEKISFIGYNKEGEKEGMLGKIAAYIPNKHISIQYIGLIHQNTEITEGPMVEEWVGLFENYTFTENDGVTTVAIEVDVNAEFENYFDSTWPKALQRLKELCE
ncbi:SRPBCC domain-containing protein [Sphingobacterium psychroaquaticum]|uniref:SRPBCC domain-containing protein n=1 Tax=Sphingobacterium psychroaquaticum TaxID=561061 RepID=UPI00106B5EB4|nr:SRPBCC domain-containing protein [Sphingobacterium psychroaquaticum]QBQ41517.1 SRPBCC domain-containing protein [Sphingobacterium psychroaquaticum]